MIRVETDGHPAQVHPAVLRGQFVHPDNEEDSGGVVIQTEASVSYSLVVFVSPYQVFGGHIVTIMAEVLTVVRTVVWIVTSKVEPLTFHTGNRFGFHSDQSCQSE